VNLDQEKENKRNLESLIQELYQQIEQENLKIQQSESQSAQLEQDLDNLKTQRQSELDKLEELQRLQIINLTDLEQKQESLDKLQAIINEKEVVLNEARQSVQEYQKGLTSLQQSLESYQARLTDANSSIEEREQELSQVQNQLQEQINLNDRINSDLKNVQESEQALKDENAYLLEELEVRQKQIDNLNESLVEIHNLSDQKLQKAVAEAWDDLNKIIEQNTEEKQYLQEEIEQLVQINDILKRENNRLRFSGLKQESQGDNHDDKHRSENLVLSQYKFAIVSGRQTTVEGIKYELETKNQVPSKNIKLIKDEKLGNKIRSKLLSYDFVVVLTSYGPHQETDPAINLVRSGSIDAHLIKIGKRTGSNSEICHQYIEEKVKEFIELR